MGVGLLISLRSQHLIMGIVLIVDMSHVGGVVSLSLFMGVLSEGSET